MTIVRHFASACYSTIELTQLFRDNQRRRTNALSTNRIDQWFRSPDARPSRESRAWKLNIHPMLLPQPSSGRHYLLDLLYNIEWYRNHHGNCGTHCSSTNQRSRHFVSPCKTLSTVLGCYSFLDVLLRRDLPCLSERNVSVSMSISLQSSQRTDELLSTFAVHLVFPIAFFRLFVEHQSVRTPFRIVHRGLALMKDIAESHVGIVPIGLSDNEQECRRQLERRPNGHTRRLQKFSLIPSHM